MSHPSYVSRLSACLALLGCIALGTSAAPATAQEPTAGSTTVKTVGGLATAVVVNGAGNLVTLWSEGLLGAIGVTVNATSPFLTAATVHLVGRGYDEPGKYGAALGGAWLGAAVGAALVVPTWKLTKRAIGGHRGGEARTPLPYLVALTAVLSIPITAGSVAFHNFSSRRRADGDDDVPRAKPLIVGMSGSF